MKTFDAGKFDYKKFIEDNLEIVSKEGKQIPLILNAIQNKYLIFDMTLRDDILKARQEGLSTIVDAVWVTDFIMRPHSYNVIVADIEDNATGLLDRVKLMLASYEDKNKIKIPMKYDSRFEMYNSFMDSRLMIGTAKNQEFGRSKTITNLHLSELALYPNIERIVAGAGQAVVDSGRIVCETTANGFNEYKKFRSSDNGFKKIFYKASDFYSEDFLLRKKKELGEIFTQEYPNTEQEAFITTGQCFFDKGSLAAMLRETENNVGRA